MAQSVHRNKWPFSFIGSRSQSQELEQAILRVSLGSLVFLTYWTCTAGRQSITVDHTLYMLAGYVAFGVVSLAGAMLHPSLCRTRLIICTVTDQSLVIGMLALGAVAALPLIWAIFWFLIGAGCRYGRVTLAVSAFTALTGVAGLLAWQPWWHANLAAGLGIAFSIGAVSLYLAVLVRRLARANQQLEEYATTDSLTGLKNRLWLEDAMTKTLQAGTAAGDMAMLLIDLDGFKAVNDAYGHDVGDRLLQAFARELSQRMREGDILVRLGGDEFVALVQEDASNATALAVAGRVHAVLADLTSVAGYAIAVCASVGICRLPRGSRLRQLGIQKIIRAADLAMYRAKMSGRGNTAFSIDEDFGAPQGHAPAAPGTLKPTERTANEC